MKSATTFKTKSLKSSLSAVALAATLFLPAAPSYAAVPTWDLTNFGQNIVTAAQTTITAVQGTITAAQSTLTAVQTAIANELAIAKQAWEVSEVKRKFDEAKEAYTSFMKTKDALSEKLADVKTSINGGGEAVEYSVRKIQDLSKSTETELSAPAVAILGPYEKACAVNESLAASLLYAAANKFLPTGAVSGADSIEKKLQANCIAQKELEAKQKQAIYDYDKQVSAFMETVKSETSSMGSGSEAAQLLKINSILSIQATQLALKEKFEVVKSAAATELAVLVKQQRELEVLALQGSKGPVSGATNLAVKTAIIGTTVLGVSATSAVNGNRMQNTPYDKPYAN